MQTERSDSLVQPRKDEQLERKTINVRCNRDRSQVRWSAGCHAVSAEGLQSLAIG